MTDTQLIDLLSSIPPLTFIGCLVALVAYNLFFSFIFSFLRKKPVEQK